MATHEQRLMLDFIAFKMLLVPSDTSSSHALHLTFPPASILKFPPDPAPQALTPPQADSTIARPFDISPWLYNHLLNVNYPITIAILYATTVFYINRINRNRGNKPWAFSKTKAFYAFVVMHNILLALYSGWTFIGMLNTFLRSWPGWNGEDGIVGAVDSLCKINGPRGLGSAVTYSSSNSAWDVTDNVTKLAGGSPDSTDVGRIWNEGLAFYGWLFYLSKFYEVVDTFIVLAKGKKSSFLQTYHHAGAMMCMWAGIRYMSSPIWMFVFVNSAIHTLMYFYYTLSALTVQVPSGLKRVITFLQISQFVFGSTYALAHLFLAYTIPAQVPYLFSHNLSTALSSVPSLTSILPTATATANMGALLKKIALRAAGEEGLAQNVRNNAGEMFGIDAVHAAEVEKAQEEIRYRLEYRTVNCIDTSGQVFAIWLNIMYLAPLTYLFADFFARSYLRRTSDKTPNTAHKHAVEESSRDAAEGVEREIHEAMGTDQETAYSEIPADVKTNIEYLKEEVRKDVSQLSEKARTEVFELSEKARHAITRSDSAVEVKTEVTETEAGESSTREHDGGPDVDGDGEQQLDDSLGALDESAYEFNLDEAKSDEEMKAEGEMQPDGVAFGTMS